MRVEEFSTFEELCAWVENNFECIPGTPRAYMEFFIPPTPDTDAYVHREVYEVVCFAARGLRAVVEKPLVHAMLKNLTEIRLAALRAIGMEHQIAVEDGSKPRMWVRRTPEFQEEFARAAGIDAESGQWIEATQDRCKIYMRFAVPGVNLSRWSLPDGLPVEYLKLNVHGQ